MQKRRQPFGYKIQNGKIKLEPCEAELVKQIFTHYVNGDSYEKLAARMAKGTIAYQEGRSWSKSMIARILADYRYVGQGEYPAILDKNLFERSSKVRPCRYVSDKRHPAIKKIILLGKCAVCNSQIQRASNEHGRERWQCPTCKSVSPQVSDKLLLANVTQTLNSLINDPAQVVEPPPDRLDNSLPILRLQSELDRELDKPECDEDAAREIIRNIAATRFAKLGSADYESERIRRLLDAAIPANALNIELLLQISQSILIHDDGGVDLKLLNGQVIERSESM